MESLAVRELDMSEGAHALAAPADAALSAGAALSWALLACCVAACLFLAVRDIACRRIPNGAVLAVAGTALAQMALCDAVGLSVLGALGPALPRLAWAAGVLACGLAGEFAWRRAHGGAHGMGLGDVKLAAACALWLGGAVLVALFLACAAAVLVALVRRRPRFAFGPYLVASFAVCLCARLAPGLV